MAEAQLGDLSIKSITSVLEDLNKTTITQADKGILLSSWIFQNFGRIRRTFDYAQQFAAADPDCASTFARSFAHSDWIDGESVVQAQDTPGEAGFNRRFHQIEADIDALSRELAKAYACIAEMRAALSSALEQLRAEINRINSDVFEAGQGTSTVPPRVPPLVANPGFINLVEQSKLLGVTKFFNQDVNVWQTQQGTILLPAVNPIAVTRGANARLSSAGLLARFTRSRAADVTAAFGGNPLTKEQFAERFGNEVLDDGRTVREVLDILPAGGQFAGVDDVVKAVADRQAAALRTSSGADAVVADHLGATDAAAPVADIPVDRLSVVPVNVRDVLARNGVASIGALGGQTPDQIVEIARREGITVTSADAAEWTGTALTLSQLGQRRR